MTAHGTTTMGGVVIDLPSYPPDVIVGDAACKVLLELLHVARHGEEPDAPRLAHRLNGYDHSDRLWTTERVEAQLAILRRCGLVKRER